MKKGQGTSLVGRHSWKKRWFLIKGQSLFYFVAPNDPTPKVQAQCRRGRGRPGSGASAVWVACLVVTWWYVFWGVLQGMINLTGAEIHSGSHHKHDHYFEVRKRPVRRAVLGVSLAAGCGVQGRGCGLTICRDAHVARA